MNKFAKFKDQALSNNQAKNILGGAIYQCFGDAGAVSIIASSIADAKQTASDLGLACLIPDIA